MYCFLTKQGTIKKYWEEPIKIILKKSKIKHHQIMLGRNKVVDEYNCYTINCESIYYYPAAKRRDIVNKIHEITKEYNLHPHNWYSLRISDITFEKDSNEKYEKMIKELKTIYVRN